LLWGALETYETDQDVRLGPRERARYLQRLGRLNSAAFGPAVEEGRTLDVDEATELALALGEERLT
jgi:hypothetical protein